MLYEQGSISQDIVFMCKEMYLQKGTQYNGGNYDDADGQGNLFSGIFVFWICGNKKNVPVVVPAVPENKINGD